MYHDRDRNINSKKFKRTSVKIVLEEFHAKLLYISEDIYILNYFLTDWHGYRDVR